MSSYLAIDVGNSNVVIGYHHRGTWQYVWRMPSQVDNPSVYYEWQLKNLFLEHNIQPNTIDKVLISSVVPSLTSVFREAGLNISREPPMIMGVDVYPHLEMGITRPNEIGSDLVCNALAACDRFGTDCIVVDFGTALTLTSVSGDRQILGVAIAPGVKTAMNALFKATAKLPEVPAKWPKSVLGQDTIHAIQSGVMVGYVGLIRHLVDETRKEMGVEAITIATGGLSQTLIQLRGYFDHELPHLTLDGLLFAWDRLRARMP